MKAHNVPERKICPGGHQKRKKRAGYAKSIEYFGGKVVALNAVPDADKNVDAAKVKRNEFPLPLPGGKGSCVLHKFIDKKKRRHDVKEFLTAFFVKLMVINTGGNDYCNKKRGDRKMYGTEMFKADIIRIKFIHGGFCVPEQRQKIASFFQNDDILSHITKQVNLAAVEKEKKL